MAIKTIPEDFVVDEQLEPAWLDTVTAAFAPYAVYRMDKRDMTTPDACDAVAKALHLAPAMVRAAGLKDRQALTHQHLTLGPLPPHNAPPRHAQGDRWKIRRLGFREHPINASAIAANRFQLVLRNLTSRNLIEMDAALDRVRVGSVLRFTNYFGSQRFGSARHCEGFAAYHLCKGNFKEALRLLIAAPHKKDPYNVKLFKRIVRDRWGQFEGEGQSGNSRGASGGRGSSGDLPGGSSGGGGGGTSGDTSGGGGGGEGWRDMLSVLPPLPERRVIESLADHPGDYLRGFRQLPCFTRQMCVEAYQSWLWNRIARQWLLQWCPTETTFTVPDLFNDLTFVLPGKLDHRLLDINLPVLGHDSELVGPWVPAAEKVLAEEGLTLAELTLPRPGPDKSLFKQIPRKLIVDATDLHLDDPVPDDLVPDKPKTKTPRFKRALRFTLPRGSYATIALRTIGN